MTDANCNAPSELQESSGSSWYAMVLPHYITPWTLPDSLHLFWPRDTHGKVLRLSPNLAQAVLCIGRIEPWNIYIVAIKRLLYYDVLCGFAFE